MCTFDTKNHIDVLCIFESKFASFQPLPQQRNKSTDVDWHPQKFGGVYGFLECIFGVQGSLLIEHVLPCLLEIYSKRVDSTAFLTRARCVKAFMRLRN